MGRFRYLLPEAIPGIPGKRPDNGLQISASSSIVAAMDRTKTVKSAMNF